MALEIAKPLIKKFIAKTITTLNIGFLGYEISDIAHKNDEIVVRNVTSIIQKESDTEIKMHAWIVVFFAIIITILSLIKLFVSIKSRKAATSVNEIP